jgi:Flp pilus assembly pilin Flp
MGTSEGRTVKRHTHERRREASGCRRDEAGATAVEYGLLLALIAAVIIAVVILLGGQVSSGFQDFVDQL